MKQVYNFLIICSTLLPTSTAIYQLNADTVKDWFYLLSNARYVEGNFQKKYRALPFINTEPAKIVKTTYGAIQGASGITFRDHVKYYVFKSIPYGKPPVGELRFKDPVPPDPWTGTKLTIDDPPSCHHIALDAPVKQSEDCLFLNIYVPASSLDKQSSLKPVLFFIHGGAFVMGGSAQPLYGPDFFIEHDVIFVTTSYRLGPLGFLSLQNAEIPGNQGLKDQHLALKFVKNNIKQFGGDPSRIMLFGESAGSASVMYHILSKQTKGLISSAVCESGVPYTRWGFIEPAESVKKAYYLGSLVNCNSKNDKELIQCLRQKPVETLVDNQIFAMIYEDYAQYRPFAFIPTIEPDVPGAFVTERPEKLYARGDFNQVPMIIGMNSREGMIFYAGLKYYNFYGFVEHTLDKNIMGFTPVELKANKSHPQASYIEQQIRNFYFRGGAINNETYEQILDLMTDIFFVITGQRAIKEIAEVSKSPVYNYHFSYDGPFVSFKLGYNMTSVRGVCHADELGYLMNSRELYNQYRKYGNRKDLPMITVDRVTKMWANFAATGNPTPTGSSKDNLNLPVWKPYDSKNMYYLDIGNELVLRRNLYASRTRFWNNIYEIMEGIRPYPEL